ncbi:MAG: hypothetical protein M0009_16355 [Deltaproteobacteria bacterium]|nr:hypothetical protein [Deltaproteobacteria bacterium]
MRVTDSMITNESIYWIRKQSATLNEISLVVSSGKQVNKPSDNPEAMGQILSDRSTISQYSKYLANISEADTRIEAGNNTLEAVTSLLESAREIAQTADDWSNETTETYLETLRSIYSQIMDLANTKLSGIYLYGGDNSLATPYSDAVSISAGIADDLVYGLADDAASVTITIANDQGAAVRTLSASSVNAGSNTYAWDGLDDGGNVLADGSYSVTVSATGSSGNEVAAYAAYRGTTGGGKEVPISSNSTVTIGNDGSIFGSALCALSQAILAMETSSYTDALATELTAALESSIGDITNEQVKLSNISSQLEISDTRIDSYLQTIADEASRLENADTTTAAVELEAQSTAYKVTLETVSNLLKRSKLTDYL